MTKKEKPAEAGSVDLRPKYSNYQGVTNLMLARPGHDIPCDRADCDRDAVFAMRAGMQRYSAPTSKEPGPNHVRCERHLNYSDGAS